MVSIGENPCDAVTSNGGCSHLCLLSSVNTDGFNCACPYGSTLGENGRTCLALSK